jgi:hypothetical protein
MPRQVGAKLGFVDSDALKLVSAPPVSPRANCWTPALYEAAESCFSGLGGVAYGSTGPGFSVFLASSAFLAASALASSVLRASSFLAASFLASSAFLASSVLASSAFLAASAAFQASSV